MRPRCFPPPSLFLQSKGSFYNIPMRGCNFLNPSMYHLISSLFLFVLLLIFASFFLMKVGAIGIMILLPIVLPLEKPYFFHITSFRSSTLPQYICFTICFFRLSLLYYWPLIIDWIDQIIPSLRLNRYFLHIFDLTLLSMVNSWRIGRILWKLIWRWSINHSLTYLFWYFHQYRL